MKYYILLCIFCCCSMYCSIDNSDRNTGDQTLTPISILEEAFTQQKNNIQVMQEGTVEAVLPDDTVGDRHQRIIVRLTNNQTLLIAHNIDLAPRIPNPLKGKKLRFYGEYEWNAEGGVVHWTHKALDGTHIDGWLEYGGKRYE